MEERVLLTLLYDFYGELLTERQRRICELYYLDDLSLGEISEQLSISRQGVHDALKRSEKTLKNYESKLRLVNRFDEQKKLIRKIINISGQIEKNINDKCYINQKIANIKQLANDLIK